jgi:hypothetical protein
VRIDALNHALRGLRRFQTCWGSWRGPRFAVVSWSAGGSRSRPQEKGSKR